MQSSKLLGTVLVIVFFVAQIANAQIFVDNDVVISGGGSVDQQGDIRIANLVADPSVINEIEMVDYQKKEVSDLIQKLGEANNAAKDLYLDTLRSAKTDEEKSKAFEKFQAECKLCRTIVEAKIKEKLLPNQLQALGSIAFQRQVQSTGLGGLFNSPIAKSLGLSDEEKEKLAKKAKEINEKLKRDIWELKKKATNELLSEMPTETQKLLKENFGVPNDDPEMPVQKTVNLGLSHGN